MPYVSSISVHIHISCSVRQLILTSLCSLPSDKPQDPPPSTSHVHPQANNTPTMWARKLTRPFTAAGAARLQGAAAGSGLSGLGGGMYLVACVPGRASPPPCPLPPLPPPSNPPPHTPYRGTFCKHSPTLFGAVLYFLFHSLLLFATHQPFLANLFLHPPSLPRAGRE